MMLLLLLLLIMMMAAMAFLPSSKPKKKRTKFGGAWKEIYAAALLDTAPRWISGGGRGGNVLSH